MWEEPTRPKLPTPKDTWRAFRAADQVETGSDHVRHLAAAGQVLAHGHLEEVEGCVEAVLVQLQLAPQVVDVAPPYATQRRQVNSNSEDTN